MTWQSALWEISLHQTTSVKQRNTGEKRQVTSVAHLQTLHSLLRLSCLWPHDMMTVYTYVVSPSPPLFQEAMRHLTGLLPEGLKQEIYGLWEVFCIPAVFSVLWMIIGHDVIADPHLSHLQEYETQSSPEARLVKEFDLLEMILQAYEYEELEGTPGRLQEFFDSTDGTSRFCLALSESVSTFLLTFLSVLSIQYINMQVRSFIIIFERYLISKRRIIHCCDSKAIDHTYIFPDSIVWFNRLSF